MNDIQCKNLVFPQSLQRIRTMSLWKVGCCRKHGDSLRSLTGNQMFTGTSWALVANFVDNLPYLVIIAFVILTHCLDLPTWEAWESSALLADHCICVPQCLTLILAPNRLCKIFFPSNLSKFCTQIWSWSILVLGLTSSGTYSGIMTDTCMVVAALGAVHAWD